MKPSRIAAFSAEPERIEIEFAARVAPCVQGRTWHESQQLTTLDDGRVRMTLAVSNDWALRSWLLGFGADVRVVSPLALASSLRAEYERAGAQY